MIGLTLTENSLEKNLLLCQNHADQIDIAELRVDLLDEQDILEPIIRFPSVAPVPIILTYRRSRDGGAYTRSERLRIQRLKRLFSGAFAYVDLEEDLQHSGLEQAAADHNIKVIRSFHDMHQVPGDFLKRITRIAEQGEIPKAAVMPTSFADVSRLFSCAKELEKIDRKILIGMGVFGVPTRILYRRCGSMLTFCAGAGTRRGAPGQLTPEQLKTLYRADTISAKTAVYGIIGNPVMHTASPAIHNSGYMKLGIDAVYVPFHVDDIRNFLNFAEANEVRGFSVTIPHKKQILPFLGKVSREVKQIGSCNTVIREKGLWKGINTDYYGFLHPILEDLETGLIRKALVIGAGGADRAVVWGLRNFSAHVGIVNRTHSSAVKLAEETGSRAYSTSELEELREAGDESVQFDLVVQTTSVGMEPDITADPLPSYRFRGDEIAYDLIYTPKVTKFLQRASQAGCRIVYGYEMLYQQGVLQFKSFTGVDYPQQL